jgi:predicted amidophosphoribosyltransferase
VAVDPLRSTPDACALCGSPVAAVDERCPSCGYHLAGVGARPSVYSHKALWWTVLAFLAIYVVVLVVVAATR